jgi:hypothetical protein
VLIYVRKAHTKRLPVCLTETQMRHALSRNLLPRSQAPAFCESDTTKPHACRPTSPPSPTRERPVAAVTRWPASWAWPPPRSWQAPRSIAAIAESAADAAQLVPAALGARRDAPDHFAVPGHLSPDPSA